MRPVTRFRDLPLVWKLLLPYLTLVIVVGSFGAFLIVRDLSTRAQATVDAELTRRSLDAAAEVHDRELYALESANLAANLQGVAGALGRRDPAGAARLLRSVLALKTDLDAMEVTAGSDTLLAFRRDSSGGKPVETAGDPLAGEPAVHDALASNTGRPSATFLRLGGRPMLAVVAPVCSASEACGPVGVVVVGIDARVVAEASSQRAVANNRAARSVLALYDEAGYPLASAGATPSRTAPTLPKGKVVRRDERLGGTRMAALYAPLELEGRRQGTLVVALPRATAFASVPGAGFRVAVIILAAIAGVVAIGALLSRFILRQVRPLVATNRALGAGDLSARAPVLGNDELGELATGVNQMAEQLASTYEHLEERVRERTEEVQRLLRVRTDLFTSVSHEFRTPLAVILAQAEAMQDGSYAKTNRWCADTGSMVEQSARQLLAFVNDILELARAESGGLDVDLQQVRLPTLVRDLRPTLAGLAEQAGVKLTVRVRRDLTPVLADPVRLGEIILNLVDNAVKYTGDGGRVELSATNGNGRIDLVVSDTGVGIPQEVGDHVFEPFYRVKGTKTQRSQPSSGLGLAVTKHLVDAHGGAISYHERAGGGTVFVVTLNAYTG